MSRTTIKAVYPGDRVESLEELSNSWGSAPPVWEALSNRYLGTTVSYDGGNGGWMQRLDELWLLWKRWDIPQEYRLVLMLTFDRAYVAKRHYARMFMAIDRFLTDFPPKSGTVNHWRRIMHVLHVQDGMDGVPGIGLYCTSVSEDPFQGAWNEEREDYDPLDWDTVFEICDLLDDGDLAQRRTHPPE
jgi:hypothetical protein